MHPALWFIIGALFGTFIMPNLLAMVRPKAAPA